MSRELIHPSESFDPDYLKWKEQDLLNSIDFYERSLQWLAERTAKYQRELEECRIMLAKIRQTKKDKDNGNKSKD